MRAHAGAAVVLVVEDDPLVRSAIVGDFQSQGWLVLEAASGEKAAALVADAQVDAVFTDIQPAGRMDGWDVAEVMRRSDPTVPIVYTSGNAPERSRKVAGSLFIDKPYDSEAVIKACSGLAGVARRNAEETSENDRFSSKGLSAYGCFVVVEGKPITLWLKAPANSEHAQRVAEFLEANVEEVEVVAAGSGSVESLTSG